MTEHGDVPFLHRSRGKVSHLRGGLALFVLLGFLLVFPAQTRASQPAVGRIVSVESESGAQTVNLLRPGKSGFARAKAGDHLFEKDTVTTGPGVKAQIELSDKSIITVGPSATLRVKAYLVKTDEGKRNYVLKALKGTIRLIIAKALNTVDGISSWKDSNVTVETPTSVAGVRGTDFFIVVDTSGEVPKVTIAVNDGVVNVRSSLLRLAGSIDVGANRMTIVRRSMKPGETTDFTEQLRDELTRATTLTKGDATGQASGKKKGTYTQADICNDISAGVPLSEVMSRATDTRMPISKIVGAALDCGVPVYDVVYTAISEGYSPQDVVTAALEGGAGLVEVVAAAIMGGAENKAIMTGGINAGYSPEEIAAVIADLETIQSPVYGYILPGGGGRPATVENTIPQTTPLIGGGGGAPASTQPASPYKP